MALDNSVLSVLIDPGDPLKDLYSGFLADREITISPIVVGEKLVNIHRMSPAGQRRALRILDSIPRLTFREDIPQFYARLWLIYRRQKRHNDLWIAAFALAYNLPVVSHDWGLVRMNGREIQGRILRVYSDHLSNLGQPGPEHRFAAENHLSKSAISLDLAGEGDYIRERLVHPQACAPSSFRTIDQGQHKLILCCPKQHWHTRHCDVNQVPQARLHPRAEERMLVKDALDLGIPILQEAAQNKPDLDEDALKSQIRDMVDHILKKGDLAA